MAKLCAVLHNYGVAMEKNCKSHSCDDPEHDHQFPDLKKMTKNLEAQLTKCSDSQMYGDKPVVEKALRAADASGLGRDARFSVRAASIGSRSIRHAGEATPTTAHVTPVTPTADSVVTYASCGSCGVVHKSIQPCPRCSVADSLTEATDWRMR